MSGQDDKSIQELRSENLKLQQDLEEFKKNSKELQDFLENDAKSKEELIKKLRQQSLKKERDLAQFKSKAAEFDKEMDNKNKLISELNESLAKYTSGSSDFTNKINSLEEKNKNLEAQLKSSQENATSLSGQLQTQKDRADGLTQEKDHLTKQLQKAKAAAEEQQHEYEAEIARLTSQLQQSRKAPSSPTKSNKQPQQSSNNSQLVALQKENQKLSNHINKLETEVARLREEQGMSKSKSKPGLVNVEESEEFRKLDRAFKDLKAKYSTLQTQKQSLQSAVRQLERSRQEERQLTPSKTVVQPAAIPEEGSKKRKNNYYHVVIRTKKHYTSPFLEWSNKLLKLAKQTKTAFSKSLGCLKYNVDLVTHEPSEAVSNIIQELAIDEYESRSDTDSIILLGNKKTSKKSAFLSIISQLKESVIALKQQDPNLQFQMYAYKTRLGDPCEIDKCYNCNSEQLTIQQAFDSLLKDFNPPEPESVAPSPKKSTKVIPAVKPKPKQKIRYVSMIFNENYRIQIITSSNIGATGFKEHDALASSLNNFVYSHLSLECPEGRKFFLLPINPIVQQYDSCKTSLTLINQQFNVPKQQPRKEETLDLRASPVREEQALNETVKKRMESFERESEQYSLRLNRLEQEGSFYRSQIEKLVIRIKNIISVQNKQNAYLKKSPIILTLQNLEQALTNILRKTSNNSLSRVPSFLDRQPYYQQQIHEQSEQLGEVDNAQDQDEDVL